MEANRSTKRAKQSKNTNIDQQEVPNDLVTAILERLPVKSLLRFQRVSKRWYNLIKSPIFGRNQLKHGRNKSKLLLVMGCSEEDVDMSFHDVDSPDLKQVRPNLSVSSWLKVDMRHDMDLDCLGGLWSNGIVCIMYKDGITLCNPALREFKSLPPRPRIGRPTIVSGFGMTCTGEYKVILIGKLVRRRTYAAHLYSTSTNSWKRICDAPHEPFKNFGHVLYFNGACHWFANADEFIILAFNMSTEVFTQMKLPDGNRIDSHTRKIVINDCLAVVQGDRELELLITVDVWIMREYGVNESWSKLYAIRPQMYMFPFSTWTNDEWLLMGKRNFGRNDQLGRISFLTNEVKFYHRVQVEDIVAPPFTYEESLIRLN